MSFILLGVLNAQAAGGYGPQNYWISQIGGSSSDQADGIGTDDELNIYVSGQGQSVGSGYRAGYLVKYNLDGAVQWQRSLSTGSDDKFVGCSTDSLGNTVAIGNTYGAGAGNSDWLIAKYDTSGSLLWQRTFGGSDYDFGYAAAHDTSGNIGVIGWYRPVAGNYYMNLAKYNSSGAIQWQRSLNSSEQEHGYGIATDSSDNFYTISDSELRNGRADWLLAKYNSSGTIQWQRYLGNFSNSEEGYTIVADDSGNVYAGGRLYDGTTGSDFSVAKYNSSGTLQWVRSFAEGVTGNYEACSAIDLDSDGNVYAVGRMGSVTKYFIVKLNSSGTLQWQRTLGQGYEAYANSVRIDAAGSICVTGHVDDYGAGDRFFLTAKLPNDGSLTGSYSLDGNTFTYAASSLTMSSPTPDNGAGGLSSATTYLTSSSSSLTSATESETAYIVSL